MATLPPVPGEVVAAPLSPEATQLRNFQRLGHLRKVFQGVPLYVLQCCANDAHNLTLYETQQLFEQKFLPIKDELLKQHSAEVDRLTRLLPPDEGDPSEPESAPKPAPKKKKSRIQGGSMAPANPRSKACDSAPPTPFLRWPGLGQLVCLPDHVKVRPGLVLIKNALSLQLQQQFADVSFALGTPLEGLPVGAGWFRRDEAGALYLNSGASGAEFGAFLDAVTSFPPQYRSLCRHFIAIACRLCDEMPPMEPSICLVNYYPKAKGIYWHRDNSSNEKAMAAKGSPVISVSIGDACDFAYKDEMEEPDRCVVLGSGDVLVFGGPSRLLLHAVPKIYPNSAPKGLKMPQKGRLNLTFRQQDQS
eukprot:GGOE01014937.1.p1 GENE.GGOE01014937.1~~GGOE01014937.1.p1  ORF type:complete len:370 (+),score=92.18 GGOE01014937.1:29-1111(+)